jgi:hypothetical protein
VAESQPFSWWSPLGISVLLFIVHGAIYLVIGFLAPFAMDSPASRDILVMSRRTDTELLGAPPDDLRATNPPLVTLRRITFTLLAGMMVAAGVLIVSLAWFGLRDHQSWALVALTVASAIVLPFWWLVLQQYLRAGASPTLGDLPPFMWIPAVLLLPAAILGWIGLAG